MASKNTDEQIERDKELRDQKLKAELSFKMKSNLYKSFMQDNPDTEESKEVPRDFKSFNRGTSEPFQNQKSDNAKSGHSKNFYSSGFKLEW